MKAIEIDVYNPASVPTLRDLIARARAALLDLFPPRPSLSPLTEAEKAEALAFARAHVENDLAALRQRFSEVKAAAEIGQRFLATSDLSAAARDFLHRSIHTGAPLS